MRKFLLFSLGCLVLIMPMAPAHAITSGVPDNGRHPYVGELLFYVPDEIDPGFDDPGSWFTCTGTLVDPTHVVSAGHCTYAVGRNGRSTTTGGGSGSGGNDVWISFAEAPDFDILPPSSTFGPDGNSDRIGGVEQVTAVGGDTRRDAAVTLTNTQGVYGTGKGIAVGWSSNNGRPHKGGTCFGDSGGPTFPTGDADSSNDNVVLTVTSFGIDENCPAGGGSYRLDQPDDLRFLANFGLTPKA